MAFFHREGGNTVYLVSHLWIRMPSYARSVGAGLCHVLGDTVQRIGFTTTPQQV
jgi:hypothetical protein